MSGLTDVSASARALLIRRSGWVLAGAVVLAGVVAASLVAAVQTPGMARVPWAGGPAFYERFPSVLAVSLS